MWGHVWGHVWGGDSCRWLEEVSGAILSWLQLAGAVWSYLKLSGAILSYLEQSRAIRGLPDVTWSPELSGVWGHV